MPARLLELLCGVGRGKGCPFGVSLVWQFVTPRKPMLCLAGGWPHGAVVLGGV